VPAALPLIFGRQAQLSLRHLELLQELETKLIDIDDRLRQFELALSEAAEGDPIFDLATRLDAVAGSIDPTRAGSRPIPGSPVR
jgi:hypothetical protein